MRLKKSYRMHELKNEILLLKNTSNHEFISPKETIKSKIIYGPY